MTRDKLVERIARAIREGREYGSAITASAILSDLDAAGLCIVPREPTEGMIRATEGTNSGVVNLDQWRAMIAAAGEGATGYFIPDEGFWIDADGTVRPAKPGDP